VGKDDFDDRKAVLMTNAGDARFCIRGWFPIGGAKMHHEWLAADGGHAILQGSPRNAAMV
jgi:hypothetical protein